MSLSLIFFESIVKALVYGRSQGEEPGDMLFGLKGHLDLDLALGWWGMGVYVKK